MRLFILPLAMLLVACPPPGEDGPRLEVADPQPVLDGKAARDEKTKSMRGLARVLYTGESVPSGRIKGTVALLAAEPSFLRLEVLDPFNNTMEFVVTDGSRFTYYNVQRKEFIVGPADHCRLKKLIPLQMRAEDAVQVLLGREPELPVQTAQVARVDGDLRIVRELGAYRDEVTIDPTSHAVLRAIRRHEDQVLYRVEFDDRDAETGLPMQIEADVIGAEVKLRIRFKWVEANPEIEPDSWVLLPPKGVPVLRPSDGCPED